MCFFTPMKTHINIGTRGSPLAMAQATQVQSLLQAAWPDLETEIVIIKTSGDWAPSDGETRLSSQDGGKGLFTKEIEMALLDGRIDCAVHSMKDVETFMPEDLQITSILEREDPRDALIVRPGITAQCLDDLPLNAVIGTASVRRAAMALSKREDFDIRPFRGNVETRLEKVKNAAVDASFLAISGLNRLGLKSAAHCILSMEDMLPAAGQGAVGIQSRKNDAETNEILGAINHEPTFLCVMAERAVLAVLDGSCHTPIGAHAKLHDGRMDLKACIASLDGREFYEQQDFSHVTSPQQAISFGTQIGQALKDTIPQDLLTQKAM